MYEHRNMGTPGVPLQRREQRKLRGKKQGHREVI